MLMILTADSSLVIARATVAPRCLQARLARQAAAQLVQVGCISVSNALGGIASLD